MIMLLCLCRLLQGRFSFVHQLWLEQLTQ